MIVEVMPAKREAFIARRAMAAFGREHQQIKAIEELGELSTALAKYMNGLVPPEVVITEIADVQVVLLQLERFFGRLQVAEERCKKLQRLSDALDCIKMEDGGMRLVNVEKAMEVLKAFAFDAVVLYDDGTPVMAVAKDMSAPKKGRWVKSKEYVSNVLGEEFAYYTYKCDQCGEPCEDEETEEFNYCPHCGADMRENNETD